MCSSSTEWREKLLLVLLIDDKIWSNLLLQGLKHFAEELVESNTTDGGAATVKRIGITKGSDKSRLLLTRFDELCKTNLVLYLSCWVCFFWHKRKVNAGLLQIGIDVEVPDDGMYINVTTNSLLIQKMVSWKLSLIIYSLALVSLSYWYFGLYFGYVVIILFDCKKLYKLRSYKTRWGFLRMKPFQRDSPPRK